MIIKCTIRQAKYVGKEYYPSQAPDNHLWLQNFYMCTPQNLVLWKRASVR